MPAFAGASPGVNRRVTSLTESPRSFDPALASPRMTFGEVTVDLVVGRVSAPHATTLLEPRVLAVLTALAERPGLTVSTAHLVEMVWEGREGSGQALGLSIQSLRLALGDDPRAPRFIETVPGIGYRWIFVAPAKPTAWLRRPAWVASLLELR